jgi:DNA repair exonuclease SbcCD nuclease subunit
MFNLGVLHTSLAGYVDHETYAPCSTAALVAKGYDYWALGHVHEHAVISQQPHIVFSGVLQGRCIRETGAKGAVLVEVAHGEIASFRHIPLDVFRWARFVVNCEGFESIEQIHEQIRSLLRVALEEHADGRSLIVRLTLSGKTALHEALTDGAAQLRDDARALAAEISTELWLEKLIVATEPCAIGQFWAVAGAFEEPLREAAEDRELLDALRTELSPFLATHPKPEKDSEENLTAAARAGDWAGIATVASSALQSRLLEASR